MVKIHRAVLERSGVPDAGIAVALDTTFGFQTNADDLADRTTRYFADSVGATVGVASWRSRDADAAARERALAALSRAAWVFAGPGSPSYALRHWVGTPVPDALLDVAHRGGTLVFGSAAACTVGVLALPVYEIYKAGHDPFWLDGLDLLGRLTGLAAVVVPHYDNAEGGGYDTRFCYLGEERLETLQARLPTGVGVLGVDEHTAVIFDTDAGTVTVSGNGMMTVRPPGATDTGGQRHGDGTVLPLAQLARALRGETGDEAPSAAGPAPGPGAGPPAGEARTTAGGTAHGTAGLRTAGGSTGPIAATPTSLAEHIAAAQGAFDAAFDAHDAAACVQVVLDLEEAIAAWSTDSLQSDQAARARRLLRAQIVRLGEFAGEGPHRRPATIALLGPLVTELLDLRRDARDARDFARADRIRDALAAAGVLVKDTVDGARWEVG
jgi:cyanophycinase-like exopeptidase